MQFHRNNCSSIGISACTPLVKNRLFWNICIPPFAGLLCPYAPPEGGFSMRSTWSYHQYLAQIHDNDIQLYPLTFSVDYSDFVMFQFTNCGMFRAKKSPVRCCTGCLRGYEGWHEEWKGKGNCSVPLPFCWIRALTCGSLLSQIQLASSFSYIVFSGSDHSVSVVCWCKNMWYVCVWNKTDRVADFPWNIRKNHGQHTL